MAAGKGQLDLPRLAARQREPTRPGRALPNQAQRAKSRVTGHPKKPVRRSLDTARGLSQRRGARKILLRSAGLLQTIHTTATITTAKVLFVRLLPSFSSGRAARTTLAGEARSRHLPRP